MKKTILYACIAAMTVFAGCQKEEFNDASKKNVKYGSVVLEATMEQPVDAETKTVLKGTTVEWKTGDLIKVFDASGNSIKMEAQADGVSVQFKEIETDSEGFVPVYAIYPYSETASLSSGSISFTVGESQDYASDSFGANANIATGTMSGGKMCFKNAFGALKLVLKTTDGTAAKVGRIEITDPNNAIAGNFTVDPTADSPAATCADGSNTVTLNCGEAGIDVTSASDVNFYVSLPAGALSNGFTAKVYSTCDHLITTLTSDKVATAEKDYNKIIRSQVRKMPEKVMPWLSTDFVEVFFIESTVDQYIDTRYSISSELLEVQAKAEFTTGTISKGAKSETDQKIFGADSYPNGVGPKNNRPYVGYWTVGITGRMMRTFVGLGATHRITKVFAAGDIYEVDYRCDNRSSSGKAELKLNGESKEAVDFSHEYSLAGRQHFGIFTPIPIDDNLNFIGRMYYLRLYDNEVLVRNMVPCYNKISKTNTAGSEKDALTGGMYDVKNGEFYTSDSLTEFVVGGGSPQEVTEAEITKVQFIESTTNQYIDTKYSISSELIEVQAKAEFTTGTISKGAKSETDQKIFGADSYPNGVGPKNNRPYVGYWVVGTTGRMMRTFVGLGATHTITKVFAAGDIYEVDYRCDNRSSSGKAELKLNGESKEAVDFSHEYSLTGRQHFGIFTPIPIDDNTNFIGRMYYFKLYDNDVLVRDMVPCTINKVVLNSEGCSVPAGTPGMYDKVTKYFYSSMSNDAFVAGPAVEE